MSRLQRIQHSFSSLNPVVLEVIDESNQHSVPAGAESHFKIVMVSEQFDGLTRVSRHRLINKLIEEEFNNGLHALSLFLYSPSEWKLQNSKIPDSPVCKGGSKFGINNAQSH